MNNHINIIYSLIGIYFTWLFFAVLKNRRQLLNKIYSSFSEKNALVSLLMMIVTILFIVHQIINNRYNDYNMQKEILLKRMLLYSLIAFITAFFAHIDLWIAPFFLTLFLIIFFRM